MSLYQYNRKTIQNYLQKLYNSNLQRSYYLSDSEIEELISDIGIFKFKGYTYAFKSNLFQYSIDDVLMVYFFDKYLSKLLMDMTSTIETKLKALVVELCYYQINRLHRGHPQKDNPFFYLIANNYKISNPKLKGASLQNWNTRNTAASNDTYHHYGIYYKGKYDFATNRLHYLNGEQLIHTYWDINYPPFHYFIESATLGTIIYLIKYIKIERFDLEANIARVFGVNANHFLPYLERVNEVRNRAAHRERLFNRSFRTVSRTAHFLTLSQNLNNHRFMDVYMSLFFMLNELDRYVDIRGFKHDEIERLFRDFRSDYYIQIASKRLTKKMKQKEFKKIKNFILQGMI